MSDNELLAIRIGSESFNVVKGKRDKFWSSVNQGWWEAETFRVFDQFLKKEHVYIDIGAWIGPTALYAAQKCKMVYGLEPDPVAYDELQGNIEKNPGCSDRIRICRACLAAVAGPVLMNTRTILGDSKTSMVGAGDDAPLQVEGLTFGEFLARSSIESYDFVKMDIEGGEYYVIPSMSEILKASRPTLYLSLHPFCLGKSGGQAAPKPGWLRNRFLRLKRTLGILHALKFYKYRYDSLGNYMSPLSVLANSMILYSLSVVFTDVAWTEESGENR